jgi:hypothetical protein
VCTLFLGTNSCCAPSHDVLVFSGGTRVVPQHRCVQCEAITNHLPAIDKDILLTTRFSAAYYIAFGPHGPRRPPPPGEGRQVFFISAGCIAAAFTLFAFTRMFANPVRPRTMTKEWQEASEEYLKVRYQNADIAAHLLYNIVTNTMSGPRIRAHHLLQGHVGPVQVREGPSHQPAEGRVEDSIASITAHASNQYRYLISLGQIFAWYRLCATYKKSGRVRAVSPSATVILVLSVQKSEAFARSTLCESQLNLVHTKHTVRIMPLLIYALLTLPLRMFLNVLLISQ